MSDNLKRVREMEAKAEPIMDNGLRKAARGLESIAEHRYSGRIVIALLIVAVIGFLWVTLG